MQRMTAILIWFQNYKHPWLSVTPSLNCWQYSDEISKPDSKHLSRAHSGLVVLILIVKHKEAIGVIDRELTRNVARSRSISLFEYRYGALALLKAVFCTPSDCLAAMWAFPGDLPWERKQIK